MKGFFDNTQKQKNKTPLLGQPTSAKGAGIAFSLASFLGTLIMFVAMIFLAVFGLAKEGYNLTDWYLYLCYILPQIACVIIVVFYLRYMKTPIGGAVKSQKCHYKYFLLAIALQFGLLSLSELNGLFISFLEKFGYKASEVLLPSMDGFGFVGVFFVIAICAPIVEELLFRGVILDGLKSGFSALVSAIVCGAMFSLYHQTPVQTVYQFCCGFAYALLAIRAGSVLPTILAHFLNNALILILYKLGINGYPTYVFIPLMIVSGLCLLGTLVYLIFFDKKKLMWVDKVEKRKEKKNFFTLASVGIAICALVWIAGLFA